MTLSSTAMLAANALALPLARAADRVLGPRGCLFTFHRVAASGQWEKLPNRDFYVDIGFLDRLLTYLTAHKWDVVTIGEAVRRSGTDNPGRYVNFSIDDCYRDSFELLAPLFRRHNVPLTLFVTTGIPDGTLPLWSVGLEDALGGRERVVLDGATIELATDDARRAAFQRIASRWDGPDAARHYAAFCAANDIDMEAMHWKHAVSWEMLEVLVRDPLIEIGAHTINHPRVATLSPEAALTELVGSCMRLNERLGINVQQFAFPYGRAGDCGPRDFALARKAGFLGAATTRKGLLRGSHDRFSLPRNTINGAHRSLAAMEMHLMGLSGAAARIAGRV